jgi:hypothetical protein
MQYLASGSPVRLYSFLLSTLSPCYLFSSNFRAWYHPGSTGKAFHFIIEILYNIWCKGEESGMHAVRNGITTPDREIFYSLQKENWMFDWMGERARQWTDTIMEVGKHAEQ